ncbi:aminotransferase class I/II-fold pyridoxal phosphate-dependent enzyme, partial [bacterium]
MRFEFSKRLQNLPPYLFVEIDKAKRKARSEGRDLIDLGVGDPDFPAPAHIVSKLSEAANDVKNQKYALDQGMPALRQAIAGWYKRRFKVILNPETEILPLIGSKEGIAHMPLAFVNPKDYVLAPDPCYPPYRGSTILADGFVHSMPLEAKNNFLPDFKTVPLKIRNKAKIMFLNYPNNPTAAIADKPFYQKAIDFACKYNTIIAHDAAYSEIAYDGYRPMSILELEGAKEAAVEFHSLSKTYNMTGFRIGWVCGNSDIISGIAKVKSNIDSGVFSAIQVAAIEALNGPQEHLQKMCAMYQERRDILCDGLSSLGWKVKRPKAAFYIWVALPKGSGSREFASLLLER